MSTYNLKFEMTYCKLPPKFILVLIAGQQRVANVVSLVLLHIMLILLV